MEVNHRTNMGSNIISVCVWAYCCRYQSSDLWTLAVTPLTWTHICLTVVVDFERCLITKLWAEKKARGGRNQVGGEEKERVESAEKKEGGWRSRVERGRGKALQWELVLLRLNALHGRLPGGQACSAERRLQDAAAGSGNMEGITLLCSAWSCLEVFSHVWQESVPTDTNSC